MKSEVMSKGSFDKFGGAITLRDFASNGEEIFRSGFKVLKVGKCLRFMNEGGKPSEVAIVINEK